MNVKKAKKSAFKERIFLLNSKNYFRVSKNPL